MPECVYCGKSYNRNTLLVRHERTCSIVHRTQGERDLDEESLPSGRDQHEVIIYLVQEVRRLNEKVNRLTNQQNRQWNLEEAVGNTVPPQTFSEWSASFAVNREHLDHLFHHGRVEGFVHLVTQMMKTSHAELPLRAFSQKKDIVYAYDDGGKWSKLEAEDWQRFLNRVDQKMRFQFSRWSDEVKQLWSKAEYQEAYVENMKKLNKSHHGEASKVRRAMFQALVS